MVLNNLTTLLIISSFSINCYRTAYLFSTIWWLWTPSEYSELVVFRTPVWDDCVTIRRWYTVVIHNHTTTSLNCFHVVYTKFWPNIWKLRQKSRLMRLGNIFTIFYFPVLVNLFSNVTLSFLFLADRRGSQCGLLLPQLICFWDSQVFFCIS